MDLRSEATLRRKTEELRLDRDKALIKIRNYQKQIDSYATEIAYCEKRIDVL